MKLAKQSGIYSLADLRQHYENKTKGHWFSPGAMGFFRSRLSQTLHYGARSIYFVSSEQGPSGVRRFSVRRYDVESGSIDTVGDFQAYKSLSGAQARAERLAHRELRSLPKQLQEDHGFIDHDYYGKDRGF